MFSVSQIHAKFTLYPSVSKQLEILPPELFNPVKLSPGEIQKKKIIMANVGILSSKAWKSLENVNIRHMKNI